MEYEDLKPFASSHQLEVLEALIEHGSYKKAARSLGIAKSTVWSALRKVRRKAGLPDDDEDAKPVALDEKDAEIRRLKGEIEKEKRRVAACELLIKEQERLVAEFNASRFDIPRQVIAKYTDKNSFIRVAFGDTHGSSIDSDAWNAFLADMETLRPSQVVHLGDIIECGGWLAAHHTTNYVAQTEYTYSDDTIAGNLMCDRLQGVCPDAEIHFIEGNHDARIETWAITTAQRQRADVDFLIKRLAPKYLLEIEKRGIHWWSRSEVHPGSVVGGTIKLGKCFFTHPSSSSKHHAAATAAKFGNNVVYGHTHRADFYPGGDIEGKEWAAWSPGCLCKLRKYWHHTEPFRHNHGYHIQLVKSDGTFLGINVPIIGGKSYMTGLLKLGSGV